MFAGIRTFPLVSIGGFLVAYVARQLGSPLVAAAGTAGAFGVGLMFMWSRHQRGLTGITTPVALVVTFLLGLLVGYGFTFEGVVVGVAATFILVGKKHLHRFARVLDDHEILSALQFITLVFILLPLTYTMPGSILGQEWLGRGALVDPFVVLLIVVFVSSISFVSLLAMRLVGPRRGIPFAGMMGGLVNSEATTASLAQRARETPALVTAAIVGSVLATTTMLGRNFAIAAVADPSLRLALGLAPYFLAIGAVGVALAWALRRGVPPEGEAPRVRNPFAVGPALKFAFLFTLISVAAKLASDALGDVGVYFTALGGFVSAGAVVASVGSLAAGGAISGEVALRTALLATAASVGGKLVILRAVDGESFRRGARPYAALTAAAALAAAAAFLLA